jgi:hypothetical protein
MVPVRPFQNTGPLPSNLGAAIPVPNDKNYLTNKKLINESKVKYRSGVEFRARPPYPWGRLTCVKHSACFHSVNRPVLQWYCALWLLELYPHDIAAHDFVSLRTSFGTHPKPLKGFLVSVSFACHFGEQTIWTRTLYKSMIYPIPAL